MIALRGPEPDARSVGQPEPAALGLLMRDLQPLALPDTLDPLVVDCPARPAQQFGDLAIAIAAVLPSKLDNIGGDTPPLPPAPRGLSVCRAGLPPRPPRARPRGKQPRPHPLTSGTPTRGGLEVSPGGLLQNELVQRQIRDCLAQPAVLELKILQALHLLALQPAKLLAPPIIRHLAHPDLADCVHHVLALRNQNIDLPQLRNDLFRLLSLPCHCSPPGCQRHTSSRTTSMGVDQSQPWRPAPAQGRRTPRSRRRAGGQGRPPYDTELAEISQRHMRAL